MHSSKKFELLHRSLSEKFNSKSLRVQNSDHLLVAGSSIQALEYIPDKSVDLIFTDPPYNAKVNYGKYYDDNKTISEYLDIVRLWVSQYKRILSEKGTLYLMNFPELNARILPILSDEVGLTYRGWITWHYPTNIGHSKKNFTRSQRSILFYTKTKSDNYTYNKDAVTQPYKNPDVGKIRKKIAEGNRGRGAYDALNPFDIAQMLYLEYKENSKVYQNIDKFEKELLQNPDISDHEVVYMNLLKNVSKNRLNKKHPCQLPLELIKRFIEVSSNPGDVVLDPFAGTFTTSVAAATLNRNSVGIELNPNYVKLGQERFKLSGL